MSMLSLFLFDLFHKQKPDSEKEVEKKKRLWKKVGREKKEEGEWEMGEGGKEKEQR
eukprot:CAMPEP_0201518680 /NCGR_PEP_ID=MMETSP0161_2-20130828/9456_1 /ASSEMBLY_ACC=CAM_ASM_000251 /TAXON_ID=180227 /ORGANISM="Neoparamoeba aestuarina, Strain SoJaBio B1-5/56/2" /LENGTH=55 /DNA_ID=CAMNT_0047916515 /DNA_START=73 /DNA_END=240 /DNA_ORIENTATION=-